MTNSKLKFPGLLYATFGLIALVIITDFLFPGRVFIDDITNVQSERQQYYNAAGNSHHSYKVITNTHEFPVEEEFADLDWENKKIEYSVSRIFKEINWYKLADSKNKSYYSLRVASGLMLPLLALISMAVAFSLKNNIDIIVFIFSVLLLADLIFLLF